MNLRLAVLLFILAAGIGWAIGMWMPIAAAREEPLQAKAEKKAPRDTLQRRLQSHPVGGVAKAMDAREDGNKQEKQEEASRWATEDPEQFAAWLYQQDPAVADGIVEAFFGDWVRNDPDKAFEAALHLPKQYANAQNKLLTRMLALALNNDWRAALPWIAPVQEAGGGYFRLADDFKWLMAADLEMGNALAALPRGGATENLLYQFSLNFVRNDGMAARRWALNLPSELAPWTMGPVLRDWANQDLDGALRYLREDATSVARQRLAEVVLRVYATKDPKGALDWVDSNIGVPGSARMILNTWGDHDLTKATEHVVSLQDPQQREAYLGLLSVARARRTTKHMLDWAETLSAENREVALAEGGAYVLERSSQTQRDRYLEFVGQLPEAEITDRLLDQIKPGLMKRSRGQSLMWAAGLPGDRAVYATEMIVRDWAQSERGRPRVTELVGELPNGPAREAAERVLSETMPE